MIAKVEPLTPARALRGPFDYRLPGAMSEVDVGSMLIVPFGRRRLLGVVVDLAESSDVPPERLDRLGEALRRQRAALGEIDDDPEHPAAAERDQQNGPDPDPSQAL